MHRLATRMHSPRQCLSHKAAAAAVSDILSFGSRPLLVVVIDSCMPQRSQRMLILTLDR